MKWSRKNISYRCNKFKTCDARKLSQHKAGFAKICKDNSRAIKDGDICDRIIVLEIVEYIL